MKTKKLIRNILISLGLLGVIVFFAQKSSSTPPPPQAGGALVALASSYDFGRISMGRGNVSYTFAVKNTGTEAVRLTKLYTSCMCTTASLILDGKTGPFGMPGHGFVPSFDKTLAPGATANVEVVFDPAAHGPAGVGGIRRTVFLEHSAGGPVELNFEAFVTP